MYMNTTYGMMQHATIPARVYDVLHLMLYSILGFIHATLVSCMALYNFVYDDVCNNGIIWYVDLYVGLLRFFVLFLPFTRKMLLVYAITISSAMMQGQ